MNKLLLPVCALLLAACATKITAITPDEFQTPNGTTVIIYPLVHAGVRIQAGDKQIYVDPIGKHGNRAVDFSTMPAADFILITHDHHDHLDKSAIRLLSTEETLVLANETSADALGSGIILANGGTQQLTDNIFVQAVPAYNTTAGHLNFHPQGRDNGYVLTIDGLRIYIAGDTEDIPEMADIKDIDIAFLPCNQPYTMTPGQLIGVARLIHPRVLYPYHYSDTDLSSIPAALGGDSIDVRIREFD